MNRLLATAALALLAGPASGETAIEIGVRPLFLVDRMEDGPLKKELAACAGKAMERTPFSIGHRGAPLMFPEHTRQSYTAAARQGAGILECDVTFTQDKELVCRHAQNDLHRTTDILATELASECTRGFQPASGDAPASAECRTADITLAEFRTLRGKMDAADDTATDVEGYMAGTASWRTDLYAAEAGTLVTHAESIELLRELGARFTPELKEPAVDMPFDGFTQADYAQKLIDEYKAAGIPPEDVWPQSFNIEDVLYWIEHEPEFGAQAVLLIDPDMIPGFDNQDPASWGHDLAELKGRGINYIAPPLFALVTNENGAIAPSEYAGAARRAGLEIITWTLERSGPLRAGGGWYFQTVAELIESDGDVYALVDVLAREVGVAGIFSDWPATVTFYANCAGLD